MQIETQILYSDKSLLIQILIKLIYNAFKYSIGKTSLNLTVKFLKDKLEIEITTYEIGIAEHNVKDLFSSFLRISNISIELGLVSLS